MDQSRTAGSTKQNETWRENGHQPAPEGKGTKTIEKYTSQLPSGTFLSLAIGSMILSAGVALLSNKKNLANFVGLWAPTILIMGLYNKLVKLEGSDQFTENH